MPRPQLPSSSWVRVRNRLAGICGSDLHLVHADGDLRVAPAALPGNRQLYPGHEVVGEVIEVGDDVQHLQVGDRVALQHGFNCVAAGVHPPCQACAAGNYSLCEQGELPGPHPIGGGWSEEMLLHEQQCFLLPDELSDEQGMLLEPASVAVHAVLRRLPRPGERVLVIGAGTIGLLTLQAVRALAPQAEVYVQARHHFQVEMAARMGAAIIHPPLRDSYNDVQRVTKARAFEGMFGNKTLLGGFDVIYDTIGKQSSLHHALRWTRGGGTIVLIGVDLHLMNIDLTPLWYREISLLGSTAHGIETWPPGSNTRRETFSITAELIQQGRMHPEQLLTHRFAISNYREALLTATGKARTRAIKVAFDYSLQPATAVPNLRASARRRLPYPSTTGSLNRGAPTSGEKPQDVPIPTATTLPHIHQDSQSNRQYANRDEADPDKTITISPSLKQEAKRSGLAIPTTLPDDTQFGTTTSDEDEADTPTLKFAIPTRFAKPQATPRTTEEPAQTAEAEATDAPGTPLLLTPKEPTGPAAETEPVKALHATETEQDHIEAPSTSTPPAAEATTTEEASISTQPATATESTTAPGPITETTGLNREAETAASDEATQNVLEAATQTYGNDTETSGDAVDVPPENETVGESEVEEAAATEAANNETENAAPVEHDATTHSDLDSEASGEAGNVDSAAATQDTGPTIEEPGITEHVAEAKDTPIEEPGTTENMDKAMPAVDGQAATADMGTDVEPERVEEKEKIGQDGASETNSAAATGPVADETPTIVVPPKPRTRKKRSKPSANGS